DPGARRPRGGDERGRDHPLPSEQPRAAGVPRALPVRDRARARRRRLVRLAACDRRMVAGTRGSGPRAVSEIRLVRGPLDEEQLGWVAALYGPVDPHYGSLPYLRHQLIGNP